MQHVLADPVNSPAQLSCYSSHRIAVPTHVGINQGDFLEAFAMPDSV